MTYAPEVGKDTWYFYFDKNSFALVGYRFYQDEAKNDSEYIFTGRRGKGGWVAIAKDM